MQLFTRLDDQTGKAQSLEGASEEGPSSDWCCVLRSSSRGWMSRLGRRRAGVPVTGASARSSSLCLGPVGL